ncbi:MAG: beta-galactosidase, partial [Bacteroidaceae bacterium]|nr:beta-galactosidase [Bacteroidaceae bacterium]
MKTFFISVLCLLFSLGVLAQWKPTGDKIKTQWAEQIDPSNVLPEYPRPIMERGEWQNLNGLWQYAIVDKGARLPQNFDGEILVPFAVESSLSGVQKRMDDTKELIYQRTFEIPSTWKGKQVLLHFGAVDWKADVWVNDVKVGSHTGGFAPFSFDITPALVAKSNKLVVRVWDPADKSFQPRGKQVSNPHGIWYTPVSGIWQTVWLEPVSEKHIANLRILPDVDRNILKVDACVVDHDATDMLEVKVYDGNQLVASGKSINGESVDVTMPEDVKLWSPDSPFLYTLKVALTNKGKVVDKVGSYAAMRKFSTRRDAEGIVRLELNNKPLFQFGPLDQGWWPDGLYTAPTDEALRYDVQKTKDFGFNMIRK